MKHSYLFALVFIAFCFAACSKTSAPAPQVDPRVGTVIINGYKYSTIIIGSQTWTSFNYISEKGGSLTPPDNTYGNYYTLAQAQAIPLPAGWRIPTVDDYNKMLSTFKGSLKNGSGNYIGDTSVARALADTGLFHTLNSTDGLHKATNASGFAAFAGGEYNTGNQTYVNKLLDAAFLTSTTIQNGVAATYFFGITSDGNPIGNFTGGYYAGIDFNYSTNYAYSLRFVKDN